MTGLEISASAGNLSIKVVKLGLIERSALKEHLALQNVIWIGGVRHYEVVTAQFRLEAVDRRIKCRNARSQLIQIGLRERRVQRRQYIATVNHVTSPDMNFPDDRCLERLDNKIGTGRNQLSLRRHDHVH